LHNYSIGVRIKHLPLVDAAIKTFAKVAWTQLRIRHEQAAAGARDARLEAVMDHRINIRHVEILGDRANVEPGIYVVKLRGILPLRRRGCAIARHKKALTRRSG
jgi:hypothetical protein